MLPDIQVQCADWTAFWREVPRQSVDLILADLPQGITQAAWDQPIPFDLLWESYEHCLKPSGCCVLFGNQPFTARLLCSNEPWFREEIIWEKSKASGHLNAKKRTMKAHENILVFSPGLMPYTPQMRQGEPYNKGLRRGKKNHGACDLYGAYGRVVVKSDDGLRYPRSVVYFKTCESEREYSTFHSTQKPQALLRHLIETYSRPGDTVLDNCMGSGSTGVACIHTDRRFVGVERDDTFFQQATSWLELEDGRLLAAREGGDAL